MPRAGTAYAWPWPVVRKQILARDGHLCQIKGPRCRVRATVVDHIVPFEDAPHRRLDPTNLRAACTACNQARTADTKAEGWRRARTRIVLVEGPPGAGKSTYVRQHASPNDLIVDFDRIAEALGSDVSHGHNGAHAQAANAARNTLLTKLRRGQTGVARAWIVSTNVRAVEVFPHHEVVTIDPGADECKRRAMAAGRPSVWLSLIDEWYAARAGAGVAVGSASRRW